MNQYFSSTGKDLDQVDTHGTLRKLANQSVRLLNMYKEIPISYIAKFMDYDSEGVACLKCHPVQAKVMNKDRYVILRHHDLSFKAGVVGIKRSAHADPDDQQEILLSRFLPVEVHTDKRQQVRVESEPLMDVNLSGPGFAYTTTMLDASSASFKTMAISGLPLAPGHTAQSKFVLPLNDRPATIEAEVVLFRSDSDTQIFRINITRVQESLVAKYINQRQVEIIKELKELPLD